MFPKANDREKRLLWQINQLVHKFGAHKPLLPDPELPQDLAFLANVIETQKARIAELQSIVDDIPYIPTPEALPRFLELEKSLQGPGYHSEFDEEAWIRRVWQARERKGP